MSDLPTRNRAYRAFNYEDLPEVVGHVLDAYVSNVLMTEAEWRATLPDGDLWTMAGPDVPYNLHGDIRTGIELAKEHGVLVKVERGG